MFFAQDAGALGALEGGSVIEAAGELLNKVDARYRPPQMVSG